MQKVDAGYPKGVELNGNASYLNNNGVEGASEPVLRVKKLSPNAILPSRVDLNIGFLGFLYLEKGFEVERFWLFRRTNVGLIYAAHRSGLAWKQSIDVGAGVIDVDYRGSVGVILFNHSDQGFEIKAGDRIAQLIVQKILTPQVLEVEELDSTFRGVGGIRSTGV
eukprot:PITA_12626